MGSKNKSVSSSEKSQGGKDKTKKDKKGYMIKDRLLRPSLVSVTKKREEKTEKMAKVEEKDQKK